VEIAASPALVTVPSLVTIPQGSTSTTFSVTAGSITGSTQVTITASYLGVSEGFGLTVNPPAVSLQGLSVSPTAVTGGQVATGTVRLAAPAGAGGVTLSDAVAELPFNEAVIVTGWVAVTDPAVAVKLAVVEPAATVTEAGTASAALLSEIVTAVPAVGAADNVTVQVEVPPDTTAVGAHCSDCMVTPGVASAGVFISI
jgi:hypothetical protein